MEYVFFTLPLFDEPLGLVNKSNCMHNYRELKIWQRSMDLAEVVYLKTTEFPKEETYGIKLQIRKSAVSIPSNISEGAGRGTDPQFKYFLEVAMGSYNELYTQTELSRRFGYLPADEAYPILDEAQQIYRMILAYYNSL